MNKLIIVESANKIKSIEGYIKELQKEGRLDPKDNYSAAASVGHILEMPSNSRKPFDPETWIPNKKVSKDKTKVVADLKVKSKAADVVLVATDPDREGEAIADDLVKTLKIEGKYERVVFNEITKDSLEVAIKNSGKIDENLVNAQITRMILDRVMGYGLSSWLRRKIWNTFKKNTGGRVQSPTLKLIVERELLIQNFKPVPYFKVTEEVNEDVIATLYVENGVEGNDTWVSPEEVEDIKNNLTKEMIVKSVKTTKKKMRALTPLKQSAVYKAASSRYGMSAAASRRAMQTLFEKGLISYPRTDSTRYSDTFVKKATDYITSAFGENYIGGVVGKKMKAGAQDAHEALRPTSPKLKPDMARAMHNLGASDSNMYKLIYTHTLQSLMVSPERESTRYELEDAGYKLSMSSSRVVFDGYYVVSGYDVAKELPKMEVGQVINAAKVNIDATETKPKARYNEGSLIEKMEEVGIGRPSTFSSTAGIMVNPDRENTTLEGKAIQSTHKGITTILALMLFFTKIVDYDYTEGLEKHLDRISEGTEDFKEVLNKFDAKFTEELQAAAIKTKPTADDSTVMIDVTKLSEPATKPATKTKKEYYKADSKDLFEIFMNYVKVDNHSIEIDWDKFAEEQKGNYLGVIMLPAPKKVDIDKLPPKRLILPTEENKFPVVQCDKCKKRNFVYRSTIRKGKPSWFMACPGYPKCRNIKNIEDVALPVNLENEYQAILATWESKQK